VSTAKSSGPLHEALDYALGDALRDQDAPDSGSRAIVALSGGLDSCVLLHLLRFGSCPGPSLVAAHYDHAMRDESAADALWVRGLCRAWGVPCAIERAAAAPRSEAAARRARYAFLERVRASEGADRVFTAHHADDQAETVLFRVLRGTGVEGLAGIPARREGSIVRPLLACWRDELEAYARRVGLTWRDDATNDELGYARNVIRHRILPEAEASVAPGARRALVRLARLAAAEEEAWDGLLESLLGSVEVTGDDGSEDGGEIVVSRDALLVLHVAVRARILRSLVARLGRTLDEGGTTLAVQFSSSGRSGGGVSLGGGVELRRRLDRLVLLRPTAAEPDRTLTIPDAGPGRGTVRLAGRPIEVSWAGRGGEQGVETMEISADRLPVVVRAPAPGDRIRLPGGTKKLKKLFLEARIPADRRAEVPVVVDAEGTVVWVPGVARAVETGGERSGPTVTIGIET
jgi:tRNA(Ile)-lysidine synthase